jgi:hypothetical protein
MVQTLKLFELPQHIIVFDFFYLPKMIDHHALIFDTSLELPYQTQLIIELHLKSWDYFVVV